MRSLVHLSDLHFGRVDDALLEPLRRRVHALAPHVVVVSGDLTQRARSIEFQHARAFLDTLPQPQIVVPGNHDVPLYNVIGRFLRPLEKYRRYVTDDLAPWYADDEIAVAGVDTARALTFKDGRINAAQIERLGSRFCPLPESVVKIVASHHPFDLPGVAGTRDLVGRAALAMRRFAECGVDLLLAGHMHLGQVGSTAQRYPSNGYAALVVQAGTATSTRGRGEPNSFNHVTIDGARCTIARYLWQAAAGDFVASERESFRRVDNGWTRI